MLRSAKALVCVKKRISGKSREFLPAFLRDLFLVFYLLHSPVPVLHAVFYLRVLSGKSQPIPLATEPTQNAPYSHASCFWRRCIYLSFCSFIAALRMLHPPPGREGPETGRPGQVHGSGHCLPAASTPLCQPAAEGIHSSGTFR